MHQIPRNCFEHILYLVPIYQVVVFLRPIQTVEMARNNFIPEEAEQTSVDQFSLLQHKRPFQERPFLSLIKVDLHNISKTTASTVCVE